MVRRGFATTLLVVLGTLGIVEASGAAAQSVPPLPAGAPQPSAVPGPGTPSAPTPPDQPLPPNPLIAAWPSQPVHPASGCTPPAISAGAVQLLSSRLRAQGEGSMVIDPSVPCHVYVPPTAVFSHNGLLRSDDLGKSFQVIATGGADSMVLLPPMAAGNLDVFDSTGGQAILHSSDFGAEWRQSGTDLPITGRGGACGSCLEALAFAASDPKWGYAAVGSLGSGAIFRTRDGGTTWSTARSPGSIYPTSSGWAQPPIIIDPHDPRHVYIVTGVPAATVAPVLAESRDAGRSWQALQMPSPSDTTLRGGLVTADGTIYVAYAGALFASHDDGAHWASLRLPVTGQGAWSVAFDPRAPGNGLLSAINEVSGKGLMLTLVDTHDGFITVDATRSISLPDLQPDPACTKCAVSVMPDMSGEYYIDAASGTDSNRLPEMLLAVRQPLALVDDGSKAATTTGPSTAGSTSAGSSLPSAPQTIEAPLMQTCQLPNHSTSSTSSGTLAYDGQSLLYTDVGDDSSQPYVAVIRKFDPGTCLPTGMILVSFDPKQVISVDPSSVEIGDMTYDARRQVLWVMLRDGTPNGVVQRQTSSAAIFTVHVTDAAPQPVEHAVANLALPDGCNVRITYDFESDSLLTCQSGDPFDNRRLSAADGHIMPSCLDSWHPSNFGDNVGWTVTRPGQVYTESENDRQMYAIEIPESSSGTCSWGTTYDHPPDGEPSAEDEQLACDSQSFSTGGVTRTVVWIRNIGHTAFSYTVPGGRCPLPTFTTYLSPQSVQLHALTTFCASTVVHFLEGYKALPAGLPVQFSVGSLQLGTGYTTGAPDVCTPPTVNPLPLGAFRVTASFPGTDAYLPSSGTGTVVSLAPAPAIGHTAVVIFGYFPAPPVPPAAPGQPGLVQQLQSAQQAQAQSQAQSEAQAQAQTQSQAQFQSVAQAQPGMVVDREKRTQIATQAQGAASQTTFEASGLRRQRAAAVTAIVLAAMLVGAPLIGRRRRIAVAPALRRAPRK